MYDWQIEIARQRQHEMLASARRYMLVKEALLGACKKVSWCDRTLARLGGALVSMGRWLQGRSGVEYGPGSNMVFLAGHERPSARGGGANSLKKVA